MGYLWLGIPLLLLLLLFCFPMRLRIMYAYSKNANRQQLILRLNGIKLYQSNLTKRKKTEKSKEKAADGSYESFMDKLRRIDAIYTAIKADVVKILKYFKNRCVLPKFVLHLDVGFADAAQTGMASGAAYGLVYGITGVIYNHLHVKKKDMDVYVQPQFHKTCIDFYLDGIFRLRVVHIISVLILIKKLVKKSKNISKTKEGGVLV